MATYGIPEHIRSDNGSEFIAQKIQQWLRENRIKTLYIDPGSPWQNDYIESFHSRFRDECLNREWLLNLREARMVIENWRQHYNEERSHSRLGCLSPYDFISVSHSYISRLLMTNGRHSIFRMTSVYSKEMAITR